MFSIKPKYSEQIYVDFTQNLEDHTQTPIVQILTSPWMDIQLPQNSQTNRKRSEDEINQKQKHSQKCWLRKTSGSQGGSRSACGEVGRVGGVRQTPHDSDLFQQQHPLPTFAAGTWSLCAHNLFQSNKLWLMVTKKFLPGSSSNRKSFIQASLCFVCLWICHCWSALTIVVAH